MRSYTDTTGSLIGRALLYCLVGTGLLYFTGGCGRSHKEVYPDTPDYDLNHPYKINVTEQLDEISGIDFYAKDTSVFAIIDEEGWLFKVFLKTRAFQKWKFGKKADYEDLERVDSIFYILTSNGDITRVHFNGDSLLAENYTFPKNGSNEFESLYYDSSTASLHMICKDCSIDKKAAVSIWSFNTVTNTYALFPKKIDVSPIAKKLDVNKVRFKPSASAVNPLNHDIYMVSSVNKVLVIADSSGKVRDVYPLDPYLYRQPEGLAFTPTGDLLISNEINLGEFGNVLILKRKNNKK
ncbi:SdiA-regulated domain-containing protein [Sediminibacterium soli]|uniref:SdiA-regulated domain-containing protein n=1 Tax=Sediminibacterium soli TaxID=2698829 RepID=UPI001379A83D|nr:SdiA-regulated domain-containing protein [Sediminibacterium soli]NCI45898.1 hypothetical protein [Sediminibacterium soli]